MPHEEELKELLDAVIAEVGELVKRKNEALLEYLHIGEQLQEKENLISKLTDNTPVPFD